MAGPTKQKKKTEGYYAYKAQFTILIKGNTKKQSEQNAKKFLKTRKKFTDTFKVHTVGAKSCQLNLTGETCYHNVTFKRKKRK